MSMPGMPEREEAGKDGRGRAPALPWGLASLSLAILLPSLGTSIANVGLPTLAEAFAASFQEVQWVVLAYLLAITTLIVSVGRLGDRYGRRRLLLMGISLFTAASVLGGLAPTLGVLVVARAAQGCGAAMMTALAMALVGDMVPKEKAGSALGLLGAMSATGTALGPSLGGVLISLWGWQALFLATLPPGILAWFLARRHLPGDGLERQADGRPFDAPGTACLAATLAAYALAMTVGRGHVGIFNGVLLLAAAAGLGFFLRIEARAASPLIPPAMLRDPSLGGSLALSALVATVLMATLVVGPFYLSRSLGLDAAAVGLVVAAGPLVAAFAAAPAGRLVDRLGPRPVAIAGLAAIGGGCLVLALLAAQLGVPGYMAAIAVITAGYALFQTANNTEVMTSIPPGKGGLVSGMLNLARNLGLITGTAVMGGVFSLAAGTTGSASAVAIGMGTTFAVAAALIVAALAGLAVRSIRARPWAEPNRRPGIRSKEGMS